LHYTEGRAFNKCEELQCGSPNVPSTTAGQCKMNFVYAMS